MEKVKEYADAVVKFYGSSKMIEYVLIGYGLIAMVYFIYLLIRRDKVENWYSTVFNGLFKAIFWPVIFNGWLIDAMPFFGPKPKK